MGVYLFYYTILDRISLKHPKISIDLERLASIWWMTSPCSRFCCKKSCFRTRTHVLLVTFQQIIYQNLFCTMGWRNGRTFYSLELMLAGFYSFCHKISVWTRLGHFLHVASLERPGHNDTLWIEDQKSLYDSLSFDFTPKFPLFPMVL